MLHGEIIPVTRKTVKYGETYLNGDIVTIPDNHREMHEYGIPPFCDDCGTCHTSSMSCEWSYMRETGTLVDLYA